MTPPPSKYLGLIQSAPAYKMPLRNFYRQYDKQHTCKWTRTGKGDNISITALTNFQKITIFLKKLALFKTKTNRFKSETSLHI